MLTKSSVYCLGIAVLTVLSGCVMPSVFTPYSGKQIEWPTKSGAIAYQARSAPVYSNLPDKPYQILGLVHLYAKKDSNVLRAAGRVVSSHGGDAGIMITSETELLELIKQGSEEFHAVILRDLKYDVGSKRVDPIVLIVKWK